MYHIRCRFVSVGLLSTPGCPGSRIGSATCSLCGIRVSVVAIIVISVAFNVPRFFQFQTLDVVDSHNVTHHMQVSLAAYNFNSSPSSLHIYEYKKSKAH